MNRWIFGLDQLVTACFVNMVKDFASEDPEKQLPFGIMDIRARSIEDYGVKKERRPADGTYDRSREAGCSNVMLAFTTSDEARVLGNMLIELADLMDTAPPEGIEPDEIKDMDRNV